MSRNQLYRHRVELCLNDDQKKIVEALAKKMKKRMNEVIRQAICEMWEKI
jgi:HD superfamily phosphodiesterase